MVREFERLAEALSGVWRQANGHVLFRPFPWIFLSTRYAHTSRELCALLEIVH